jgi:hypothetical protein
VSAAAESEAAPSHETGPSQKTLGWTFLVALAVLRGVGGGLLWMLDESSVAFELLTWYGFNWLAWHWLVQEMRVHRASYPLDTGWLAMVVWTPVAVPVLWRYERWRGVSKAALVALLWLGATSLALIIRIVAAELLR